VEACRDPTRPIGLLGSMLKFRCIKDAREKRADGSWWNESYGALKQELQ
jgi:hypothetical protein